MSVKNIILGLLGLVLLLGGWFAGLQLQQRRCASQALEVSQGHSQEILQARGEAAEWASSLARAQGEALLRAFVSGISPAILTGRMESLEIASSSLLRVTGISGIHIISPAGKVQYSSDAKLATTGELGEGGVWALAATEMVSRDGSQAGTREYAVPLISTGKVLAVIWMEFSEAAVRDAGKPSGLSQPIGLSRLLP